MADAVGQLMKQVADKRRESKAEVIAARERVARQARMRWLQAAVLAITLVISLMFAIPRWRQPFAAPTGASAERAARRAVVFATQLVEQRIRTTGRAPQKFDEIGVPLPGIYYQRLDSLAYVVSITVEGKTLQFRRGDDPERFVGGP
jgi:hypothetical protein